MQQPTNESISAAALCLRIVKRLPDEETQMDAIAALASGWLAWKKREDERSAELWKQRMDAEDDVDRGSGV
jgi:hypothetical protein